LDPEEKTLTRGEVTIEGGKQLQRKLKGGDPGGQGRRGIIKSYQVRKISRGHYKRHKRPMGKERERSINREGRNCQYNSIIEV